MGAPYVGTAASPSPFWYLRMDLNHRHTGYEPTALTAELRRRTRLDPGFFGGFRTGGGSRGLLGLDLFDFVGAAVNLRNRFGGQFGGRFTGARVVAVEVHGPAQFFDLGRQLVRARGIAVL